MCIVSPLRALSECKAMEGLENDVLVGHRGFSLSTPAGLRQHLFKVGLHVELEDELW